MITFDQLQKLICDVKDYYEKSEVAFNNEYDGGDSLEDLLEQGNMPKAYFELCQLQKDLVVTFDGLVVGTKWVHPNGNIYTIIGFDNIDSTNDKYKPSVIYQGDNGKIWGRTIEMWYETDWVLYVS